MRANSTGNLNKGNECLMEIQAILKSQEIKHKMTRAFKTVAPGQVEQSWAHHVRLSEAEHFKRGNHKVHLASLKSEKENKRPNRSLVSSRSQQGKKYSTHLSTNIDLPILAHPSQVNLKEPFSTRTQQIEAPAFITSIQNVKIA